MILSFPGHEGGGWVALGQAKLFREASPWERGRFARIGSAQQSAVASGTLLAFSILRGLP
ncbi:MAG: hypothetical protein [Olavius algarvensis Gamma 1 endosymbiont]|nr:MAG: hypothetical protein [Olavius algarvensis Gamma 1 endosymbiont]